MSIAVAFLHFVLIFCIGYWLAKRWGEVRSKLYWSALVYHLVAGLCVGLVYQYYYSTNDTWFFFETAAKFADLTKQDFTFYINRLIDFSWDQRPYIPTRDFRSILFIKMISLFCLIGDNNYWACAGYFSLLSFTASWFLFRKVTRYFNDCTIAVAIAFLFFPSVVFWSSGIEKETLALVALYFLAGIFLQVFYDRRVSKLDLAIALVATIVLWALKYYWAGVFFIAITSVFAVQRLSLSWAVVKRNLVVSYFLLFAFIGLVVSFLHPNFYLHRFLEVIVSTHDAFVHRSNDHNLIHYYELRATVKSVIINTPWALVSGFFRPFIGEGYGALGLFASLENLIVLILFISCLWKFRKHSIRPMTVLALAVIGYCIVLCIFLALSTPNLGTLSRYRVGFLPFLIFVIAYNNPLVDWIVKKFSN